MGGMFDPVHLGHLNVAKSALQILGLDEFRFVPCGVPVHRDSLIAGSEHRIAMLKLAIEDAPRCSIDSRECLSAEPSYTVNSLIAIREEEPQSRLYFLMGLDAFVSLPTWYRWQSIFEFAHVIVAARPGVVPEFDEVLQTQLEQRQVKTAEALTHHMAGKIFMADMEEKNISSTMVRKRLSEHADMEDVLPVSVIDYIESNNLYRH